IYNTDGENVRAFAKKHERFGEIREEEKITDADKEVIDRRTEDRRTGEVTSETKRRMREKKVLTDDELLELHALDPDKFKIRTVTSNEWTVTTGEGEQWYNFQSRVIAAPKVQESTPEFIAHLFESVKPQESELNLDEVPRTYLLIPLSDFHWGLNYAEDYEQLKKDIKDLIIEGHSEILFVLNGDYFHVDNFQNTTERGTRVDDVDFERATKDAHSFIIDLLKCALEHSPNVKLSYLPGNHAPSVDYMFT